MTTQILNPPRVSWDYVQWMDGTNTVAGINIRRVHRDGGMFNAGAGYYISTRREKSAGIEVVGVVFCFVLMVMCSSACFI